MRYLLALLALLLFAAPVQAQRSLAERIEDLRRASAVKSALVQHTDTRAYDVDVRAEAGVVSLAGTVPTLGARTRIEEVTRGVPGVRSVRNDLRLDGQPNTPIADAPTSREPDEEDLPEAAQSDEPLAAPSSGDGDTPPVYHVVQQDDTLYAIARRYGTTVSALQQLNGMGNSTSLGLGQRLRIR